MKRMLILACLMMLFATPKAFALASIDTVRVWDGMQFISSFGVTNTATYGQTIVVRPETGPLLNFAFEIGNCSAQVNFRAHIFAWDTVTSRATGASLFDGPVQSVAAGAGFTEVTVNTGSLQLSPGTYVFFASTSQDQTGNTLCRFGAVPNRGITGGQFVYRNNGTDIAQWTTAAWSTIALDLAFKANFQQVASSPWHNFFAVNPLETPMVGDFNGDGKTDIITFTRQNPLAFGDVYVALSDGTKFGDGNNSDKWQDFFAISTNETVVIGDYDGDGKDDVATWLGTTSRQVYVALSLGTAMAPESVWETSIGFDPTDVIAAGDANGDGMADLVLFARKLGKVYVALSNGTQFGTPTIWHNFFAVSTFERPRVGDLDGDGKADIITFATDSPTAFGDVYVAISDGTKFGDGNNSSKWQDFFSIRQTEEIRIGDLDGDGKDDFFTFLPSPFGQLYTALSQSTQIGPSVLWPETVAPSSTDLKFVGDANGDGKADVIVFAQGSGTVYVSLMP